MTISLDDALQHAMSGRAILFAGAGMSLQSANTLDLSPPLSQGLSKVLAAQINESQDVPLDVIADAYRDEKGAAALVALLQQHYLIKQTSSAHQQLSGMKWLRIFTTNYDDAIEHSRKRASRPVASFVRDDVPDTLPEGAVVHLKGFVSHLTTANLSTEIILSFSQHVATDLFATRWAALLRQDFKQAQAIVFLGYSLSDLDIAKVLLADPKNKEKTIFIVEEEPPASISRKLLRYGTLLTIGTKHVADRAAQIEEKFVPSIVEPLCTNFRRAAFDKHRAPQVPTAEQSYDFLVKGLYDSNLFSDAYSRRAQTNCIFRTKIDEAGRLISGDCRLVVVHSDTGNGKTVFLDELEFELRSTKQQCFRYAPEIESVLEDVRFFLSLGSPCVLIFDELSNCEDEVKYFLSNCPNVKIVGGIRTAVLELQDDIFVGHQNSLREIDLNSLDDEEVNSLSDILTRYGLWGDRAEYTRREQIRYITSECHRELSATLLGIVRSEVILNRLKKLYQQGFAKSDALQKVLCGSSFLIKAGYTPSLTLISELIGFDAYSAVRECNDSAIDEFMPRNRAQIVARSPVMTEVILRDIVPDLILINNLVSTLRNLHARQRASNYYRKIYHRLMRFSFVESLLTERERPQKLIRFYEAVRQTGFESDNPQFWLQYAIARMSFEDYEKAEGYFDTAYSLANKREWYDTYQIDNHYARFLLESRTRSELWGDYFIVLCDAHKLVTKQMQDKVHGFYPFRVATRYLDLVERRRNEFSPDQVVEIREMCHEILNHLRNSAEQLRRHQRNANECKKALERVLKILDSRDAR
jgi:tetratricopeptide (TPR) repeat protein